MSTSLSETCVERITALEIQSLAAGEEIATLKDALRASQAQVATLSSALDELLAHHRASCKIEVSAQQVVNINGGRKRTELVPRGLTLSGMPTEILMMIVAWVDDDTQDEDEADIAFQPPWKYRDDLSVHALACTSRLMRTIAQPSFFFCSDSRKADSLIGLLAAVVRDGKGPLIRGIDVQGGFGRELGVDKISRLLQRHNITSSSVQVPGFSADLTQDEANPLIRACDEEQRSELFVAQVMVIVLQRTPALQSIHLRESLLRALEIVAPGPLGLSNLTCVKVRGNLSPQNLYDDLPIRLDPMLRYDTFGKPESLSSSVIKTFGPLPRLQVLSLDAFERNEMPVFCRQSPMPWPWLRTIALVYDQITFSAGGLAADSAIIVRAWQELFEKLPKVEILWLTKLLEGETHPPLDILPKVVFPPGLRYMRLQAFDVNASDLAASISHCKQLQTLRLDYSEDYSDRPFAPYTLPPSLKVFKLTIHEDIDGSYNTDVVLPALRGLLRYLQRDSYPASLCYICLDSYLTKVCLGGDESELSLTDVLGKVMGVPLVEDSFWLILMNVILLDEACKKRGITLCGPSITSPLLTSTF